MWENADQKNTKYEHFLRSENFQESIFRGLLFQTTRIRKSQMEINGTIHLCGAYVRF